VTVEGKAVEWGRALEEEERGKSQDGRMGRRKVSRRSSSFVSPLWHKID